MEHKHTNDFGMLKLSDNFIEWIPNGEEGIKICWNVFNDVMKHVPEKERKKLQLFGQAEMPNMSFENSFHIIHTSNLNKE